MSDLARLRLDIETAEGFRRIAYKDTRGFWTAGYGHFLDQTRDWSGVSFPLDQIQQWLDEDIGRALAQAQKLPEWNALDTDARENAVGELVFNMGLGTWESFTTCRLYLQRRVWAYAHDDLLKTRWAQQVGSARSQRIADYILTGKLPCPATPASDASPPSASCSA